MDQAVSKLIIGVDEVGVGAIAGPLVVAACYIPPQNWEKFQSWGFADSKELSPKKREKLFQRFEAEKHLYQADWVYTFKDPVAIDRLTPKTALDQATRTAILILANRMHLDFSEVAVILDGDVHIQSLPQAIQQIPVVKADSHYLPVSIASVMAKVIRDTHMKFLNEQYPLFALDKNKGYPTQDHLTTLLKQRPVHGLHRHNGLRISLLKHYDKYMHHVMVKPAWLTGGW